MLDIDPPNGYTIRGEGKGGPAGFAKGGAKVSLESVDNGTLLRYEVDAKVGGKLAQLGSRMIDATAKKLAGEFFGNLSELVAPTSVESTETDDTVESGSIAQSKSNWSRPAIWISGALVTLALLAMLISEN